MQWCFCVRWNLRMLGQCYLKVSIRKFRRKINVPFLIIASLAHVDQCTCNLFYRGARLNGTLRFFVHENVPFTWTTSATTTKFQARPNGREILLNVEPLKKTVCSVLWMHSMTSWVVKVRFCTVPREDEESSYRAFSKIISHKLFLDHLLHQECQEDTEIANSVTRMLLMWTSNVALYAFLSSTRISMQHAR